MIAKKLKSLRVDECGISLIELVVSLSLTVIVIGVIGTFFISNYHSFYQARDMETLLAEVTTVTKTLDDTIRESKGIVEVKKTDGSYNGFTLLNVDGTRSVFLFTGSTITQKNGAEPLMTLTTHATKFTVLPIQTTVVVTPNYVDGTNNDFTASQTRGMQYSFTLVEGKATRDVTSQISFRNKD